MRGPSLLQGAGCRALGAVRGPSLRAQSSACELRSVSSEPLMCSELPRGGGALGAEPGLITLHLCLLTSLRLWAQIPACGLRSPPVGSRPQAHVEVETRVEAAAGAPHAAVRRHAHPRTMMGGREERWGARRGHAVWRLQWRRASLRRIGPLLTARSQSSPVRCARGA